MAKASILLISSSSSTSKNSSSASILAEVSAALIWGACVLSFSVSLLATAGWEGSSCFFASVTSSSINAVDSFSSASLSPSPLGGISVSVFFKSDFSLAPDSLFVLFKSSSSAFSSSLKETASSSSLSFCNSEAFTSAGLSCTFSTSSEPESTGSTFAACSELASRDSSSLDIFFNSLTISSSLLLSE